jgi:hypothetical protein
MGGLFLALIPLGLVLIVSRALPRPADGNPLPFLPDSVSTKIQAIYTIGQARGNRPDVFSKVGDSITVSRHFLQPIGYGAYNLGEHTYLKRVIEFFSKTNARKGDSFSNPTLAAGVGWAAWAALNPANAKDAACERGETPLACEYRVVQPAFALILFGTNDVGYRSADQFRADIERIADISMDMGVIPIFSTIPIRPKYEVKTAEFNQVVRDVTTRKSLPLWDYGAIMTILPNGGLSEDYLHPSAPPDDANITTDFRKPNLQYGYVVRNLTALQILDRVWRQVEPDAAG